MSYAQSVPVVVPCSGCSATYNIVVQMVKTDGREHWRYEIPDHCTQCGERLNTLEMNVDVRMTAKAFL